MVVKIGEDGFWLFRYYVFEFWQYHAGFKHSFVNSDTSCTKPTEPSPTLADAKGSCIGIKPTEPTFATDFATVIKNVRKLEDIVATQDRDRRGFVPSDDDTSDFKFRHIFF